MVESQWELHVYCKRQHLIYLDPGIIPGLIPVPVKNYIPGPGPGKDIGPGRSLVNIGLDLAIWKFRYFIYDSFWKFMDSLVKVIPNFDVGGAHQARQ